MVRMVSNPSYRLVTFKPLCFNKQGRAAIQQYGFPPYIDASCRREPDLQSAYPSLTALCRANFLAPKLKEGDEVAYMTKKGAYKPHRFPHWRLVAILRVLRRFDSHEEAAAWYSEQGLPLPSNCMVSGNDRLPFDMTGGFPPKIAKTELQTDVGMRVWDRDYKERAGKWGAFLVCDACFLELYEPPVITREMMLSIFDETPQTQNPQPIKAEQFEALRKIASAHSSNSHQSGSITAISSSVNPYSS
jgi:hypothetical protein